MPRELTQLEIPGFSLAARLWGDPAGPPVLALHGWLDNAASFDTLAPLLSELQLVALDLPGHGLSAARASGQAYHFVDWLPVVFDVADSLGWHRFSLLGHSMGAGIAALAAGAVPERIERLALMEALGPLPVLDAEVPARVDRFLNQRTRVPRQVSPYVSVEHAAQRLQGALKDLSLISARHLAARGTRPVPGGVVWRADARLRHTSPLPFNEAQVLAFLARIRAEVLLIRANQGFAFDEMMLTERCRQVDRLRVVEVSGGHHVHLEHPDRVLPALRDLFGLPPGSG